MIYCLMNLGAHNTCTCSLAYVNVTMPCGLVPETDIKDVSINPELVCMYMGPTTVL